MKNKGSGIVLLLCILSIFYFRLNNTNWGVRNNYGVISYDDFGYYLYLPATFIYHDPALSDKSWLDEVFDQYNPSHAFYQAHPQKNGNHVIQYTMGMSIMYAPAFFLSHLYCLFSDEYPADGFSIPYQLGLLLYSLLWLSIGLSLLRKLLLKYFSDGISALVLLSLVAGTNYFHIAINNTTSPHIFLFTNYVALILLTERWYRKADSRSLIALSVVFAIQVLSRPNEAIFILLIVLWGVKGKAEFKERIQYLKEHKKQLIKASILVISIGLLQSIYWLYTSGKFFYDSYIFEDFKLTDPYLEEYLFSYKKGWWLYTPLMLLLIPSYVLLYKKKKDLFYPLFVFGLLNIWILSSWDCWWYADSFSQRSVVQSYPMYLLPLGFLYQEIYNKKKWIWASLLSLFLIACFTLNLFQIWQQRKWILHTLRMTKEYYWAIFGDTVYKKELAPLLSYPRGHYEPPSNFSGDHFLRYYSSYAAAQPIQDSLAISDSIQIPYEGYLKLDTKNRLTEKINSTFESLNASRDHYYVVKFRYYSKVKLEDNPIRLITEVKDVRSGKNYGWGSFEMKNGKQEDIPNRWNNAFISWVPPYYRSEKDSIWSQLIYDGDQEILIDDLSIEVIGELMPLEEEVFIQNFNTLSRGNWSKPQKIAEGGHYELIDKDSPKSSTLKVKELDAYAFANFHLEVQLLNTTAQNAYLIVSIETKEEKIHNERILLSTSEDWQTLSHSVKLLDNYPKGAVLRCYLWNDTDQTIAINYIKATAKK